MLKFSSQEEFGVRFLIRLAYAKKQNSKLTAEELANYEGVSIFYARKILNILRSSNLIVASQGKQGSWSLKKEPAQISLKEAFQVLRSSQEDFDCGSFTGKKEVCVHASPSSSCNLLGLIKHLESSLNQLLEGFSLEHLIPKFQKFEEKEWNQQLV